MLGGSGPRARRRRAEKFPCRNFERFQRDVHRLKLRVAAADERTERNEAEILDLGRRLATVVHPTAVVASGVTLGPGTYLAPLAVVHTDAQVGRGCIVNSAAVVEHDCRLGDWVHVSPGAALGPWATLGAGAVMVHSMPDHATAIGVPARVRDLGRRHA